MFVQYYSHCKEVMVKNKLKNKYNLVFLVLFNT